MIKKMLQHHMTPIRFADTREFWATFMTRFLSQPECDFLMGHCSASIFMANYFAPRLDDLKQRTLTGIVGLQDRLVKTV
jgi:hypothetical protein